MQSSWHAGAYFANDRIVVHSQSRTRSGVGWYNQPVFLVPHDASSDLLGQHVREALNGSIWDSLNDDSQNAMHPIVRQAGAKNWRNLENRSKHVSIETDKHVVKVLPSRWVAKAEGGRGFIPLLECQIEIKWNDTDAELGSALRRGFEASHTKAER